LDEHIPYPHRPRKSYSGEMMERSPGLLVVDRGHFLRMRQEAIASGRVHPNPPVLGLTDERVSQTYRGFDDLSWPEPHPEFDTVDGIVPLSQLEMVKRYFDVHNRRAEYDMIILSSPKHNTSGIWADGFSWAGIDVGYFESEWSHFSCIINEIIFSSLPELRAFAPRLNECLLFGTEREVDEYLSVRARLHARGADLEEGAFAGISVHAFCRQVH